MADISIEEVLQKEKVTDKTDQKQVEVKNEKKETKKKRLSLFRKSRKGDKVEHEVKTELNEENQMEVDESEEKNDRKDNIKTNVTDAQENVEEKIVKKTFFRNRRKEKKEKTENAEDESEIPVKNEENANESLTQAERDDGQISSSAEQPENVAEDKEHPSLWKRLSKSVKKEETLKTVGTQSGKVTAAGNESKSKEEEVFENEENTKKNVEKPLFKEKRRSFVPRLRKWNKTAKSTNTENTENVPNVIENENTEDCLPKIKVTDDLDDSFYGVYAGEKKAETVAIVEDTNVNEDKEKECNNIECIPDSTPVDNSLCPVENIEDHDESNESSLTTVTAVLETILNDVSVNIDETNNPFTETSIETNEKENINSGKANKTLDDSNTELEDPLQITSDEEERVIPDEKVSEETEKCLDFVLVGHLNEKQKDESFILAKKAINVYKNAHLSQQYCSNACCTLI